MVFGGIKGEMYMIFGFTAVTMAQGKRAVTRLQLEEQNREESPSGTPSPHHDCAAHSGRHRDHHPSIAACLRCKGRRTERLQERR